jgi:hypothetical protein
MQSGQDRGGYNDPGPLDLPDPAARLCPTPSACASDCSRQYKQKEFAAGAPRQKPTPGPRTRDARCQSDAPHTDFAMVILARSVSREYPSPAPAT